MYVLGVVSFVTCYMPSYWHCYIDVNTDVYLNTILLMYIILGLKTFSNFVPVLRIRTRQWQDMSHAICDDICVMLRKQQFIFSFLSKFCLSGPMLD